MGLKSRQHQEGIITGVKHETAMRYLERHGNIKNRSLSLSKCPCSKHIKKRIKKEAEGSECPGKSTLFAAAAEAAFL